MQYSTTNIKKNRNSLDPSLLKYFQEILSNSSKSCIVKSKIGNNIKLLKNFVNIEEFSYTEDLKKNKNKEPSWILNHTKMFNEIARVFQKVSNESVTKFFSSKFPKHTLFFVTIDVSMKKS